MDRAYFEEMYNSDPDPWRFESSWYEQRKYALTMAALPDPRYRSAFEPGSSIGVLSALLAERCDQLLATDIVPGVIGRARERCRNSAHARFEVRAIPDEWPVGPFDLVVFSEIAYYFDRPTLRMIIAQMLETTSPNATVVGVHWRGPTNYPLRGDEAHDIINSHVRLTRAIHYAEPAFVLDVWHIS